LSRFGLWRTIAIEACLTVLLCAFSISQQNAGEYQAEAAYLYNFARMTHWPSDALPPDSHLVIGVFGGDQEFMPVMRKAIFGRAVNGHSVEARYLRSPEEIKFCNVVFFRVPEDEIRSLMAPRQLSDILLVGESQNFLTLGGMINLVFAGGKMTYAVNTVAIANSGLKYGDSVPVETRYGDLLPGIQPESARPIVFRMSPHYPPIAATLGLNGAVQLEAVVRADGTVKQVRVLGGHPILADAAARALKQWRYQPAARETTESVRISFGQ
jgi:TonB family protein